MSSVEQTQPLISHLLELRNRLLRAILAVLVVFVGLIYFSNEIYEFVSKPLVDKLPEGATMIATDVASPFFTPLNVNFNCFGFRCCTFYSSSGVVVCCSGAI